ncbi:MAG: hypothetical protein ACE5HB_06660 [Terriglobia bacterium]
MAEPRPRLIAAALGALLLAPSLGAQQGVDAAPSPPVWAAPNLAWLRGQVTPNPIVPDPDPARRRLLVSYEVAPEKLPHGYHRSYTYDNALAALAFFVAGEDEAAAYTLHALARLLRADGSLWFSYNTANGWPDEEYHQSAMVRAGAIGWAGYAFAYYLRRAPACAAEDAGCARERRLFRRAAERLAGYLVSQQVSNPGDPRRGLIPLGYGTLRLRYRAETDQVVETYVDGPAVGISTENNISAWFFLRDLSEVTGEARWREAAGRIARGLLRATWSDELGQFSSGFHPWGELDTTKALDCASWGALFLQAIGETEKARHALEAVEAYYAAQDGELRGYRPYFDYRVFKSRLVNAYFFPEEPGKQWRDLPLVWTEGSLGAALAYLRLGQSERARKIVSALRPLQTEDSGLRYASKEVPYQMSEAPSVASSAWLVLVTEALAGNPRAELFWQ